MIIVGLRILGTLEGHKIMQHLRVVRLPVAGRTYACDGFNCSARRPLVAEPGLWREVADARYKVRLLSAQLEERPACQVPVSHTQTLRDVPSTTRDELRTRLDGAGTRRFLLGASPRR